MLSLIGSKASGKAPVLTVSGDLLDVIKLEEAKYASMSIAVVKDPSAYMCGDIFDQALFWAQQKAALPVHYALWGVRPALLRLCACRERAFTDLWACDNVLRSFWSL